MHKVEKSSTEKILEKKRRFLQREQHVVAAALDLLLEQGVDKVTVSAIAHRAGIGKGTIYKHFLTKNEIYMRIVLDYERGLAQKLSEGIKLTAENDPSAASRVYFQSRLSRPALDRLVQQLEIRLEYEPGAKEQMDELQRVRKANLNALNSMVERLIETGVLEDVPPSFHYLSCWALAQGAVDLYFNPSLDNMTNAEKQKLLEYITSVGVTMGNRNHSNR